MNANILFNGLSLGRLKQHVYANLRTGRLKLNEFMDMYEYCTSDPHDFLAIDNRGKTVFMKNFEEVI
jgi:hypothetical protein